jgi:fatty-acyl-CoA synthase
MFEPASTMNSRLDAGPSWGELLVRRSADRKPWLIVDAGSPSRPSRKVVRYAELSLRAGVVARSLPELVPIGSRILVVMDNSVESAVTVIAALAGGMVPVPIAPPLFAQASLRWLTATQETYGDCQAALLVGPDATIEVCALATQIQSCRFAVLTAGSPLARQHYPLGSDADLALLQYTSGTTARARGVRLTHAQLKSNIEGIGQVLGVRPDDVGLCWLPLAHDMGLIGSLLFATYWGISLVLMKPQTFLMHPESWLRNIDRERVSLCAAPNSAYWLCATKIPEHKLRGLDLSCWRAAINGAELIHPETVTAFSQRFARYGFDPQAMRPAFGLAECATAVCLTPRARGLVVDRVDGDELEQMGRAKVASEDVQRTREVVSVGKPLPDHEVRIVADEGSHQVGERVVGAIQIRGPSVTHGYFGAARRREALRDSEGWLWTGDRGYLAAGELYVLGRSKATLKRAGRSIDCAYVENAVRTVPGVRSGRVAAVGVPTPGSELLVIVAETDLRGADEREMLTAGLCSAARAALAFVPDAIVLSAPGSIPRTTSGKVRYEALRAAYLAGRLPSSRAAGRSRPRGDAPSSFGGPRP